MRQAFFATFFTFICLSSFAQNGATLSDNPFGQTNSLSTQEFLPVTEAYQVEVFVEEQHLQFTWTIQPGYYLYRDRFKFKALDQTTTLGDVTFEPAKIKWDEAFQKDMAVYYNQTTVTLPFSSSNELSQLQIESQGCADAGLCYPPHKQWLNIDLQSGIVEISNANPLKENPATSGDATSVSVTPLPLILFFALLGGMILNLMPCVFPVLSIKALSFTTAHHSTHGKHLHGLAYTAGIVSTFVAIAALMLVLRSAGEAVGWGFQLQSPFFVSFLIYLFFIMGLSFSGYLEIGTRLMSVGQSTTTRDTLPSSFLTGVLATTVASPCTAPFMGSALGFAATQSAYLSILVFAFLGLGMALPFILLAWIPRLSEKLPKPGPWMETFKQFLAFPLYATATWLLWVAGRQTSMDVAATLVLGIILIAMGLWLWKLNPQRSIAPSKGFAIVCLMGAISLPSASISNNQEKPSWRVYSPELLAELREEGRPVFVNMTADWCITCIINERVALSSESFKQALSDNNIVYLKGDWTNSDPQITTFLANYNRNGVPLYVLYPQGRGEAQLLPQILTEESVLQAINNLLPGDY